MQISGAGEKGPYLRLLVIPTGSEKQKDGNETMSILPSCFL
jgi:hypothetical protein